ncbi:MAG: hypothetical protein WCJ61_05740 [Paludibacter sp.]
MKIKLLLAIILAVCILQSTNAQNATYKGIDINESIREGYKQYSKSWAQINITGLSFDKQYTNIMSQVLIIDRELTNGNLQAYDYLKQEPQKNIFGSFDSKDSRNIALALLYSYLEKVFVKYPELAVSNQSSLVSTKKYYAFVSPSIVIAMNYFGGNLDTFKSGWQDNTTYDRGSKILYVKEAILSQIIKLEKIDFSNTNNDLSGIDTDIFLNLKSSGDLEKFKDKLRSNLSNSELFRIADRLNQGAEVRQLLTADGI